MPPRWTEPDPIRDRIRAWRRRGLAQVLFNAARQLDGWHERHADALDARQGRRLGRVRRALVELARDVAGDPDARSLWD